MLAECVQLVFPRRDHRIICFMAPARLGEADFRLLGKLFNTLMMEPQMESCGPAAQLSGGWHLCQGVQHCLPSSPPENAGGKLAAIDRLKQILELA